MQSLTQTVSAQSVDYMDRMLGAAGAEEYKSQTVGGFVSALLPYIYGISTVLLLASFVVAAFRIGIGGKKGLETIKKTLIWSVIGYAVVMGAAFIVQLAMSLFTFDGGTPGIFGG